MDFGWAFAFHVVGACMGALTTGIDRDFSGRYLFAWIIAAGLCFLAAISLLLLPGSRKSVDTEPENAPGELDPSRVN